MDEKLQIFNQLVYHGKLHEALRFLTNKHTENTILQPDDVDTKTGKSVLEVLKSKHPSLRIQDITQDKYKLDKYDFVPQPLDLHITENDVKLMAPQLHGSGGPTSLDSSLLTDLLLRYGISSTALRTEMANWSEWLANESPPWAAYRATMATRAVAFNKFPGVRPLSIGESYRRLWARLIISQTRDQAKAACNTTELCAGLETGIDAAIHAVRACTLSRSSFQTPIDTYHNSSSSQSTSPTQPSPSSNHSTPSDPNPSSSTKSPTSPSCPPQSTSPPSTTPPSIPPDSPSNPSTSLPIKPPSKAPPDTTHSPTSQSHTASSTIPTRTTRYNLRPRTPKPNDSSSLPPTSTKQSSLTSHPPQSTQPNIMQSPTSPIIPPPSYPPNSPTSSPSPPPTSSPSSNLDLHTPPPPSTQPTKPPTTRLDPSPHNPTPNTPTIPNPKSPSPPPSSPSLSTPSTSPHQTSTAPSSPTTPLDVTLLDASNGFNEISRLRCLHTIRHLWPSASRFAFNCYRHSIQVCIRQHNSPATIIPGCEGIQQGDPLSMILYGLALTPMIDRIHTNNSSIFLSENFLDPWYADDATIVATVFDTITIVQAIQNLGPIYGYFIQPEKSIHICSKLQIPKSKPLFQAVNLNFQYVEGTRYLGSYIGEKDYFSTWIKPLIQNWISAIQDLSLAAIKFPQAAYAVYTHCLQNQWSHICRTTPNLGPFFIPIENTIKTTFLPALFHLDNINDSLREVLSHPIKLAGLNNIDPTIQAGISYDTSLLATQSLVDCLLYHSEVDLQAHRHHILDTRQKCHQQLHNIHNELLTTYLTSTTPDTQHRLARAKIGGSWLTVIPKAINGTILSAEEFRDNLRL
ncbi:hypothetical protein ACHAXS_003674 [Conticribra weissflogii]